jgi:hypothetical protein
MAMIADSIDIATLIQSSSFLKWAFSDFLSNSLRGILAEYIVAIALDCTDKPRTEWDAYDLKTADGTKIEVKSSAYLQSWEQKKPSAIRFDIGAKQSWDAETNISQHEAIRSADIYIFSVFATQDRTIANPIDTSQWFFLVTSSMFLNRVYGTQKSIGLSSLEKSGITRCSYGHLKDSVELIQKSRSD